MATVIETVEIDGEVINIYESGARYNVTQGRLIYPASNTMISAENATAYNRRRQELARAELVAGANEAVEHLKPDVVPLAGDLAYVRAIGYATQQKAMTPKDAKQTDAARLMLSVGAQLGEQKVETINNTMNVIQMPAEILSALTELHSRLSVVRTDILNSDNDAHSSVIDVSPTDESEAK